MIFCTFKNIIVRRDSWVSSDCPRDPGQEQSEETPAYWKVYWNLGPGDLDVSPASNIYSMCDLRQVVFPLWACFLTCEMGTLLLVCSVPRKISTKKSHVKPWSIMCV